MLVSKTKTIEYIGFKQQKPYVVALKSEIVEDIYINSEEHNRIARSIKGEPPLTSDKPLGLDAVR